MKYFCGEQLKEYEKWVDEKIRPDLVEALRFPAGEVIKSMERIERGFKLIKYLKKAKKVEERIK